MKFPANILKSDNLFIFLILVLNPALWEIKNRISALFPDSVAYIILSKKLFSGARLYVDQWGHIDHGLILPPVYPFFIGVADYFIGDGPFAAELVSNIAIILSSIPLYFFVKNISSKLCAFLTIIVIQMNFNYLYFGTLALTEATFIFMLCCGFFIMQKSIDAASSNFYFFYLGIVSALIFLTRHVGITFIISVLIFFIFFKFKNIRISKIFIYVLGLSLLFVPYSYFLYKQTGKSYLTQHFRFGKYVVPYSGNIQGKPEVIDPSDYGAIYGQRRSQRALLADSSEIISYTVNKDVQSKNKIKSSVFLFGKLTQPKQFLRDIVTNFSYLGEAVGLTNLVLLLFLLVISVFNRRDYQTARLLLPLFLAVYIPFMSLLTSAVDRYIIVIFPFAISALLIEFYHCISNFKLDANRKNLLLALAASLILFLIPAKSWGIKTYPKDREQRNHLKLCSKRVSDGDSIFTIHPYLAYVLGGSYRVLPNDSLEKIARYASLTGVKWMLLPNLDETKFEYQLYTNAKWLSGAENPEDAYPELVKLRCRIDNNYWLFEFLSSSSTNSGINFGDPLRSPDLTLANR